MRPPTAPWTTIDRSKLRADTPGCQHRVHLNNAGAALPPRVVTQTVIDHLRREEMIGAYEAADETEEARIRGRQDLASLLGTEPKNLALVESSTVGLHRVLTSVPLRARDRVLVTSAEYAATVLPLIQLSSRIGLKIDVIPDGPDGTSDPTALARMLDDDVKLVCAVHVPSHNGLVNDVAALGQVIKDSDFDPWYVVDACQSVGQIPVSASKIGSDFLFASGRKYLRGPRGTGVLVVSDGALDSLDAFPIDGHGGEWHDSGSYSVSETARRYETYERSIANSLGLMAAARYALDIGIDSMSAAIRRNAEYLRSRIGAMPGWDVLDRGRNRSGIVTIRHESISPSAVKATLAARKINVSLITPSTNPRDLGYQPAVRLSPHAYNNCSDLDLALDGLARCN
jgi:cysteine desulfurase/selenocysteine lyase